MEPKHCPVCGSQIIFNEWNGFMRECVVCGQEDKKEETKQEED
jgi:predicted nucleic acid-binding Zn ribbon protein